MDNLDFSEEEIQEQLTLLGYRNIPKHRLREFKHDLDELIRRGEWKSLASPAQINPTKSQTATSQLSPPAYTKEKVSHCYFRDSGEGFFLHVGQENNDRPALTTCQNRDYGRQQGHCDSYAQHSVAPKLRMPPGAPGRLQVEPDPDETLHSPLTDSCTSTPDTQGRRHVKRKVLRKHKGQSLVCDESVYSEDSAAGAVSALRRDPTEEAGAPGYQLNPLSLSLKPSYLHRPHAAHTSAVRVATMYRMYNSQSDDDKSSLNSSFWSDGERQDVERDERKEEEEEEEEVEIERVISDEDSKPLGDAEDPIQEASEEEKPELNKDNMSGESVEGGSDDDNDDDEGEEEEEEEDEDESCSSSCDSPAPSLMTSGYGTYRPEEQDGGDYRDDHTITEFDQDSRGDLSEARDDDDDRSLCSFGGYDIEPAEPDYDGTRPLSVSPDAQPEADRGDDGPREEVDITGVNPEEDDGQAEEEGRGRDLHAASGNEQTSATAEEQHHNAGVGEDRFTLDGKSLEGVDVDGRKRHEDRKEENTVEKEAEDKVESDESSSNKDIKFIDSKVDFSQMTYEKMCEEWEGNLRHNKDAPSCLEDRLAQLHLSTAARHNFETENEDVASQSDTQSSETDGVSMSAFESYIRGMTQAQSDTRPKPKSFIQPVRSQQTMKKTDPVAKYFQYKQLWEMFKLPGETDRRALRLEIKERLAYQPPPPKPRRVYVPNTYIVPTEKKRSALRWEIRNDLANGLLPYKFSYRF